MFIVHRVFFPATDLRSWYTIRQCDSFVSRFGGRNSLPLIEHVTVRCTLGIIAYTLRVYIYVYIYIYIYMCTYRTKNFGKYIGLSEQNTRRSVSHASCRDIIPLLFYLCLRVESSLPLFRFYRFPLCLSDARVLTHSIVPARSLGCPFH